MQSSAQDYSRCLAASLTPPSELAVEKDCFVYPDIQCATGIKGKDCLSQYHADFNLTLSQLIDLRNDFIEEVRLQTSQCRMQMHYVHLSYVYCCLRRQHLTALYCRPARGSGVRRAHASWHPPWWTSFQTGGALWLDIPLIPSSTHAWTEAGHSLDKGS